MIIDFENFPNNAFDSETAEYWFIVSLAAIHSLQRKNYFSVICRFLLLLRVELSPESCLEISHA